MRENVKKWQDSGNCILDTGYWMTDAGCWIHPANLKALK